MKKKYQDKMQFVQLLNDGTLQLSFGELDIYYTSDIIIVHDWTENTSQMP